MTKQPSETKPTRSEASEMLTPSEQAELRHDANEKIDSMLKILAERKSVKGRFARP